MSTLTDTEAAAGDSIAVAGWTVVSRVTGVVRFGAIGAVLGPTFFANTYQVTNSLPNLVYYGFLAGSLFSSLLVPALVRHIDAGDRRASERVAGGFLGVSLLSLAIVAPVAIGLGPWVLRAGGPDQMQTARWLIAMFVPQIFCYGVVGSATAVMNARRRFALAAAAPAIENVGILVVLGVAALRYGTGNERVGTGELLLLGLGTTGAVAAHAAVQWWGARRAGVILLPRKGWRDEEVRAVVRRAVPSLGQAGLVALQVLALLTLSNRVPGGVVAFQLALAFYYLAIALGATPVALSLLPRLARMHLDDDRPAFRDALVRGLALGFFVTVPAAVGYLTLAYPIARAVSYGRMGSGAGVTMVAVSLAALSVAVVAQTAFLIGTYASYARKDTRSPLRSMVLQAGTCLGLASLALLVHGPTVLLVLGLAFSVAVTVGALHLGNTVRRTVHSGQERLAPSLVTVCLGALAMAGPAWLVAQGIPRVVGPPLGAAVGLVAAVLTGGAVYLAVAKARHAPELRWLAGGVGHLRGKARGVTGRAQPQPARGEASTANVSIAGVADG
jgi:putative peptidoglycan lipid II flippase